MNIRQNTMRLLTEAGKSAALFMLLLLFCVIERHHFATAVIVCATVVAVRGMCIYFEFTTFENKRRNQQQKTLQREP